MLLIYAVWNNFESSVRHFSIFNFNFSGSSSTGSTKSGTMELYTTSSYNETISGGGETLSSISERSCMSSQHQHHQQHQHFANDYPTPISYMVSLSHKKKEPRIWPDKFLQQEDNFPYSRSTYLIDPPESQVPVHGRVTFEQGHFDQEDTVSGSIPPPMPQLNPTDVDNPMSLYSVIHKDRKAPLASREETETPCDKNYEDTESEYAVQLRRQTHRHLMGENGGYVTRPVAAISSGPMHPVYATLPGKQPVYQQLRLPHPAELDLDLAGMQQTTHFNQPTSPLAIQTDNVPITPNGGPMAQVEGPICASSPKRTMSAFTTFGPQSGSTSGGSRSNASTPMSPPPFQNGSTGSTVATNSATPSPQVMNTIFQAKRTMGGAPTTGHLVWIEAKWWP